MLRYVQAIDLERQDKARCMRRPPATVSAELRAIQLRYQVWIVNFWALLTSVEKVSAPSSVDEV